MSQFLSLTMCLSLRLIGVAVLAAQVLAAATDSKKTPPQQYGFTPSLIPLQENAGSEKLFPMPECFGFQLEEATIDEMQAAMKRGQLTSVQLVTCYMMRTFQTEEYSK